MLRDARNRRVTLAIILGTYLEPNVPYTDHCWGYRSISQTLQKDPRRVLSYSEKGWWRPACDGEVGRVRKRNNKILRTLRPSSFAVHAHQEGSHFPNLFCFTLRTSTLAFVLMNAGYSTNVSTKLTFSFPFVHSVSKRSKNSKLLS